MNTSIARRDLLRGFAATGLVAPLLPRAASAQADLESLTLYGPPAGPSIVLAQVVASGALADHAKRVGFEVWRSPDQLRAGVTSGRMQVTVSPTYVAANLYNRGAGFRLLNVMTWGLLYVATTRADLSNLENLGGGTVVMPFRNDMPDLVFRHIASQQGLAIGKDIAVEYVSTPTEATQLLLSGRYDTAILSEPAATAAILRGQQSGVGVRRALDLQKAWGEATGGPARIPQAGLMVADAFREAHSKTVAALMQAAEEASAWVKNNPATASTLASGYLELPAPVIERAIPHMALDAMPAQAAKEELESFFDILAAQSPDIIGGKLPSDDFYLG